jgi:hypothetical protein
VLSALAGCTFPDVSFGTGGAGASGRVTTIGATSSGTSSLSGATGTGGNATGTGGSATGTGGATSIPGIPVALGAAEDYVVLSEAGITNLPPSTITGSLGVSPIALTAITGFVLTPDPSNAFSTSPEVSGRVYAASHAAPTPSKLIAAVADMQSAFGEAAARAPDVSELGAGDIGGMTLGPGVYRWATGLAIPTSITLSGNATDVWIFQIAQSLHMTGASHVALTGGALARNVFWQVSGLVDLGAATHLEGVVLTATSAAMHTGASIKGRLLAQTSVSFQTCFVSEPGP